MSTVPSKKDLAAMATTELLKLYNAVSGKPQIKRFSSKSAGVNQTHRALLAHAGNTRTITSGGKEPQRKMGRPKMDFVIRITQEGGSSKPQSKSTRSQVLAAIKAKPNGTTMKALEEQFGKAARGCVQKLVQVNWVTRTAVAAE